MISRRDALKLGAAGALAKSTGLRAPTRPNVTAQDSPGGLAMHRGNEGRTGLMPGPAPRIDRPIIKKWSFSTQLPLSSSPLIVDNVVYISGVSSVHQEGAGLTHALNLETGEIKWEVLHGGVPATPAASDNQLYVGCDDGTFMALDINSGAEVWRFYADGGFDWSSPAIDQSNVYVGSLDSHLYAIDRVTGNELWRFKTDYLFVSSPALANDLVVFGGGRANIHALNNETGEELWRVSTNGGDGACSAPAIWNDMVFAIGDDGFIHALDLKTGNAIWKLEIGGHPFYTPSISDSRVFVDGKEGLLAIDAFSGEVLWQHPAVETGYYSHSLYGGELFVVGGDDHSIQVLNTTDGQLLWSHNINLPSNASTVAVSEGILINTEARIVDEMETVEVFALGNLDALVLTRDVDILGAPAISGIVRSTAKNRDSIDRYGTLEPGSSWIEVTHNGVTGWIPLDAIDPSTLPPEGEIEYVYVP